MSARDKIKMLYWNAQSMNKNQTDTFQFICNHNIDIELFQETWLKPNIQLHHPDYMRYRLDRLDRLGGCLSMAVHKSIKHTAISPIQTQVIDNIGIE